MQRPKGNSQGPTAPTKLPAPGMPSSVGPRPPALPKPKKNTRDYGKATPQLPQPSPFPEAI